VLGAERVLQVQDQFLLGLWIDRSQALKGRQSWLSIAGAASLIGWIILTAASFGFFADRLSGFSALQMLVVQLVCNVLGLGFSLWMILQIVTFLKQHSILRRASAAEEFEPTPKELVAWQKSCALLRHVPELSKVHWRWRWFPAGTLLVRKNETDREFHWLASGEANVVGVSKDQKDVQFAKLFAGSGFGEIVFLHGGKRSADVFLRRDSVVATLSYDVVEPLLTSDLKVRLESLVQASQAMDVSHVFHAMPSQAKEEWLCHATICDAVRGDTLITVDTEDTWMGLVVHGGVAVVERSGRRVAELERGGVFGEMALWTRNSRVANITAQGPLTYLRWESDFWATQAKASGIDEYLNQLVAQRQLPQ
jgi:CRP-like cAMP-binding protein